VSVDITSNREQTRLYALPAGLSSVNSIYGIGQRLPYVPWWKSSLLLGWKVPAIGTQFVFSATHWSLNNTRSLPPFSAMSLAAES